MSVIRVVTILLNGTGDVSNGGVNVDTADGTLLAKPIIVDLDPSSTTANHSGPVPLTFIRINVGLFES